MSKMRGGLRVGTDGLVEGLRIATKGVDGAAQEMRTSLKLVGDGAKEAAPHFTGLNDALKEWRTHVRTEARYTNFMAAQVAGLGFASKGAAAELTGLVSAFAFGGGLGLAVEGVKLVAHVFNDIQEAEKKAKEEFDKYVEELVAGTEKIKKQAEIQLMALAGASKMQIQAAQDIKPLLEEREALEKKIAKAEEDVVKLRAGEGVLVAELGPKQAEIEQKELDRMREKVRLLNESINARQRAEGGVATVQIGQDLAKDAEKDAKDLAKKEQARRDHLARVHAAEAAAQVALDRMVAEHTALRVQIDKNFEAIDDAAQAKHDKEVKDRFDAFKQQLKEIGKEGEKFGAVFGATFEGIASGTMTVTKAFADMAKETVKLVFDAVKKKIEAYALEAAAAAAAANAGIPGIGVFVAMAAAAAMEAAVNGLLSQLPSAAGGFDIPRGMNPVTQLHSGEMVLPEKHADVIRGMADDGSGGSGSGQIVINALDARSFEQFLLSPGASTAMVRSIKNLYRARRL